MRITHKAYFLHPEIPPEGEYWDPKPGDYRLAGWPRIAALAKFEGIIMRRDPKTIIPFTRPAQAATIFAAETSTPETVDAFHKSAYRAYWEDAANLGDLMTLERLMKEHGLDWETFKPRLETNLYDGQMQLEHDEAMQLGLNGVPSFVIDGKFGIVGAQPIETFIQSIKRAIAAR